MYIEVIGCFVWVSGDTKPHKEELKKLRFSGTVKNCAGILLPKITAHGVEKIMHLMRLGQCMALAGDEQ